MEKLGFGRQAIFALVKDRPHGIIHVRENCYGWHGPWTHRSGWQQISDAVSTITKPSPQTLDCTNHTLVLWSIPRIRKSHGSQRSCNARLSQRRLLASFRNKSRTLYLQLTKPARECAAAPPFSTRSSRKASMAAATESTCAPSPPFPPPLTHH
jgi:hypothetical protein